MNENKVKYGEDNESPDQLLKLNLSITGEFLDAT